MSEDTDSSGWLKDMMTARLDGQTPVLDNGHTKASTLDRIGQDNHEQFLHFSNPSLLPASAENTSSAEFAISPAEASANEKIFLDEEQMVEGDNLQVYPSLPVLVTLTIALMITIFMIGLDTNIIGTAIPKITGRFHSLDDVGWYGSAYLLTQLSLQSTFGKLYSLYNIKWVYIAALLTFEIGSSVCASAPSSVVFIIGRAISGTGSAGIYSGSLTIGANLVPLDKKPLYVSIVSSMYGVAAIAGPLLGGVFTDSSKLTWRFCFWVNLPCGFLAILIVATIYKPAKRKHSILSWKEKLMKMDFAGSITLISAIVCLLLALQGGGTQYAWSNSKVWGCLIGFGCLLSVFIILQFKRGEDATIPLRILSQRSIAFSSLYIALINMAIDTHIYYLPFYFQAVKGTSAETSGIRILPYLLSTFITALATGSIISTLVGYYVPFMTLGALILTAGCALIQTLKLQSREAQWFGYEVLTGIGFGTAFQIPYSAVQVVLSPEDLPIGNALVVFFQALGGALAVSIGQNVLSNTLLRQLERIPQINASSVIAAGATNLEASIADIPPALLENVRAAYSVALSRTYVLPIAAGGLAVLCSLGVENRSVKKKKRKKEKEDKGKDGEERSVLGLVFRRNAKQPSSQ